MTSTARQAEHRGPRGAVALVRLVLSWLLVAVLAVDLGTSPLHGHRHDGEWSAGGALVVSSAHAHVLHAPGSADLGTHVEHEDAPGLSHSISALRGPVEMMADVFPLDEGVVAAPWLGTEPRTPRGAAAWPPDRPRAGASAFRSLPPNGRAPPLHG